MQRHDGTLTADRGTVRCRCRCGFERTTPSHAASQSALDAHLAEVVAAPAPRVLTGVQRRAMRAGRIELRRAPRTAAERLSAAGTYSTRRSLRI